MMSHGFDPHLWFRYIPQFWWEPSMRLCNLMTATAFISQLE
jgi:hypothetical protein